MNYSTTGRFALWELAVLSLLRERPMHPYEIQRLLKARHKDDVLVLKRGSLYHAIRRLESGGLIELRKTTREGKRPERMTYGITASGRQAQVSWLKALVSAPQRERSDFMGAMSFLVYLRPAEAIEGLASRVDQLEHDIAAMDTTLEALREKIGRINVIETEYARAMRRAELDWVRGLLADLRARRFSWDLETLLRHLRSSGAGKGSRTKTTP